MVKSQGLLLNSRYLGHCPIPHLPVRINPRHQSFVGINHHFCLFFLVQMMIFAESIVCKDSPGLSHHSWSDQSDYISVFAGEVTSEVMVQIPGCSEGAGPDLSPWPPRTRPATASDLHPCPGFLGCEPRVGVENAELVYSTIGSSRKWGIRSSKKWDLGTSPYTQVVCGSSILGSHSHELYEMQVGQFECALHDGFHWLQGMEK